MISAQELWKLYERYVEAWADISSEQRRTILTEVLAEEIHYFTPNFEGNIETVIEDIEGFQKKFPGAHFDVEDGSAHHDVALFTWVLVQANGEILVKGHDQIRVSPEGKIADLITFAPSKAKPE